MYQGITKENRLSIERKAISKTQQEMARIFNLTDRQYRDLEKGTSQGSIGFWYRAKEYYQKSIGYLLGWEAAV
jgi:transcriptional regulator with XRE-family HTH domain